ncbi:translocation/assembly module TamB domain-containing protein [Pseudomonas sp. 5P_3.1_Bac2]|uniref:translocation/assembly module TamB domain-containing protein n=1 Tax=Pseudomonas sp. 5P_3.1_Bac2 TaxID=2971617 RepID=UPI0021C7B12D|nr:translocation/assembly module TamB domain-containing protein [Pseudomonas sp. 5P_3.1_Bac2]MCU1717124.1 translocation/assembly module TamB [Pseudomonas sp. 5P_3.1_Bac2]
MTRWLKRAGLLLLSLVLLLVISVYLALASEAGSRWLLGQIPGLSVHGFSGQLGGTWQAERVRWQQGDDSVELQGPQMSWSPACLLHLTLCVERLHSGPISLNFAPSESSPDDAPISLPALRLPLAIQLGDVQLASLSYNASEQLQSAQLVAHWNSQGMQIDSLKLSAAGLKLDATGQLDPSGNWPLKVSGQLSLPEVQQQPWQLAIEVAGDLQQRLQVAARSSGYLQGSVSGWVEPLLQHLPAQVQIAVAQFKASPQLPDSLTLEHTKLEAIGDLRKGYALNGSALVAAEQGPIPLTLKGLLKADGLDLQALDLSANEQQQLALTGQLNWAEGLSAEAKLHWTDFPWQRLYPLEQPPQVALKQLNAELSYANGNYLGNFSADLDGPAGAFSLQSPVSGDLSNVHLPEVQLQAGQGKAEGQVSLGFADALKWQVQLQLSQFDPSYWLAELPGNLAGSINSKGDLQQFDAALAIQGRLRNQPTLLQGQYSGSLAAGALRQLELRLGDNRISGQGQWAKQLEGQLEIAMPRLGQLWPGLQGTLNGQLALAGSLNAPQGSLDLKGANLGFEQQRISTLTLAGRLNSQQQAQVDLLAAGIVSADQQIGQLHVKGSGDLARQELQLDLTGPLLQAEAALSGGLSQGNWRGNLARAQLRSGPQDWRLQQPASIERLADGSLSVGAHCWRSGAASLCGQRQQILPQPKLDMQLRNLSMASLQPWLPPDFAWQGELNGTLQLQVTQAGPSGTINVDAGSGLWRVKEQQNWLDFAYEALNLKVQLKPQRIDANLELRGPRIGQLQVTSQIDPRPASKPIRGSFNLSGLDLAIARPFVPMVEQLSGQLRGNGEISGSLLAPQINGSLRLVDGTVAGGELPMNLQDVQLLAQIQGQQLQLDGGWRSGAVGQAKLQGQMSWAAGLNAELSLKGSQLPVSVEPYANLEVSPDLRLTLAQQQLAVSGSVLIPKGAIEVRELPPSTVQLSKDAKVVGQSTASSAGPAIAMDIDVQVGQERLSFKGFGLTAEVAGRLHIGNDLDARGELALNKGRFRAYGQRLNIRRARILFTGPIDEPFIDVEAVRKVDDVTAGLRLTGSATAPSSEVFSEPAMSQEQALSYLVLGRPLNQSSGDNNMLAQAALALGMAGGAPLINNVAQDLGISDFSLDTQGSGATTSVVASGQLSERLSLRYGVGVFEPANTIALRYELTRKLFLEAASGLASSLDLFYRRDF